MDETETWFITTILPWICLIAASLLILGPIALTVAAALWEKRIVWYFVPVNEQQAAKPGAFDPANPYASSAVPQPSIPPPSVDAAQANSAAQNLGFEFLGTFRDAKGASYKVRYDFWVSPERDVLVNVGCGTVFGIPVDARWLYTRLQDGRLVVSVTDQAASEYDFTGQRIEALVSAFSFQQLLQMHRQRVAKQHSPPVPFGPDPLKDYQKYVTERIESLVRSGYASYRDIEQNAWSYSFLGALLFGPLAHAQAFRRQIVSDATLGR